MTFVTDGSSGDLPSTLPVLARWFQDSGAIIFVYDENDRLAYGNAKFYDLICHPHGTHPSWSDIVRDNYRNRHGLIIETRDVESWIEKTLEKRRSKPFRQFEIDVWDGRWFLLTETWVPELGLLGVGVDITQTVRSSEALMSEYQNAQLRAETDLLTQFGNRRALERLRALLLNSGNYVSALIIDIDQFKAYNDALGHSDGDACLQQVADVIRGSLQEDHEFPIRLGGDEFLVLIPDSTTQHALQVARKIIENLREIQMPHPDSDSGYVSLSIGFASKRITRSESFSSLLKEADESLYRAKGNGRDRLEYT